MVAPSSRFASDVVKGSCALSASRRAEQISSLIRGRKIQIIYVCVPPGGVYPFKQRRLRSSPYFRYLILASFVAALKMVANFISPL